MSEWIALKNLKPNNKQACLVGCTESDCILMAMFISGLWFTYDNNPEPVSEVTHWMPLPSPPTGSGE